MTTPLRRHSGVLFAASALLSMACGSLLDPRSDDRRRLDAAHARWVAAGVSSYEIVVHNQCFCGYAGIGVRVVVQQGAVVSRTFVATGQPVPDEAAGAFRDIEGMFGVLRDALGSHVASLQASYNATYGYPTNVFIDYSRSTADEEFGFVVESFVRH